MSAKQFSLHQLVQSNRQQQKKRKPHPLAQVAERLGRSQGRQGLPDVFEQYLKDAMERESVAPRAFTSLIPSRDLMRQGQLKRTRRRPDC